jgi:hypothetical protein
MREVEFRDGMRLVPDHVAQFMESLDTYTMTYAEAAKKVNNAFLTERLKKAQSDALRQHFERFPKS